MGGGGGVRSLEVGVLIEVSLPYGSIDSSSSGVGMEWVEWFEAKCRVIGVKRGEGDGGL